MASNVTRDHHTWTRDTIKNVSGDVTLDLAGDLTIDVAGGQMTVTDNSIADPDLIIHATGEVGSAGNLIFLKDRGGDGGTAGQDDDALGFIQFNGYDTTPGLTNFGLIKSNIVDASGGSEIGSMSLLVITEGILINAGQTGLFLTGTDTNGEVDVTIANGAASVTTIAGDLTVTSDTQLNSSLTVGVDDLGYDAQFFGFTAGKHMLWNASADALELVGGAVLDIAGAEGGSAILQLRADEGDDDGDSWKFIAQTSSAYMSIANDISGGYATMLSIHADATATSSYVKTAGNIRVGGNIIQASDGGSTITMDTDDNVTIAGDLDIDGDTITSAGALEIDAGGDVTITGQDVSITATKKLYLDGTTATAGGTYITEADTDILRIYVGGVPMIELDETNGEITFAATNHISALADGTEFSAANSSYAGMILGYTVIGLDETPASYDVTDAMIPTHDDHKVSFVFPPSGKVEIMASIYVDTDSVRPLTFGLSTASATDTYASLSAKYENHTYIGDETDGEQHTHRWHVTGTPGDAEELWFSAGCTATGVRYVLRWGGDSSAVADSSEPYEYQPFVMKATALPLTVYTG